MRLADSLPTAELSQARRLVAFAQEHDYVLHQHSIRVAELTATFAAFLGYSETDRSRVAVGALFHDIGKLKIDAALLRKPSPLTPIEIKKMHEHPDLGRNMLAGEGVRDEIILAIVGKHHERLDGSGYPAGLHRSAICEPVRIVTLCDVFAAMTEPRPYAITLPSFEALSLMAAKRTRLDLPLLDQFASMIARINASKSRAGLRIPADPPRTSSAPRLKLEHQLIQTETMPS